MLVGQINLSDDRHHYKYVTVSMRFFQSTEKKQQHQARLPSCVLFFRYSEVKQPHRTYLRRYLTDLR
ncbi:hypothetical protein VNO78_15109 [Psophocarpus tetragonolobus]|uniref:Uncharacterized protein n=1 Tax=Psophocarpus tetragonolobus TaxID=3891 RepID=A0AAN9SJ38_PSOTE